MSHRLLYSSKTNFDPDLMLDITEWTENRTVYYEYEGLRSMDEAKRFAKWWEDTMGWGYSPRAFVEERGGKPVVRGSRWNSCD